MAQFTVSTGVDYWMLPTTNSAAAVHSLHIASHCSLSNGFPPVAVKGGRCMRPQGLPGSILTHENALLRPPAKTTRLIQTSSYFRNYLPLVMRWHPQCHVARVDPFKFKIDALAGYALNFLNLKLHCCLEGTSSEYNINILPCAEVA